MQAVSESTTSSKVKAHLGGVPFVDETFQPRRLLAAVASVRLQRLTNRANGGDTPTEATQTLTPDFARNLYGNSPESIGVPSTGLGPSELERVDHARALIATAQPGWRPLMSLPVRYLKLLDARHGVSASIDALPQHVFLSDEAFVTDDELCEQVLHESCHNWMYLISELWKTHWTGRRVLVTLPSGTGNRTPSELLGAMHVITVLLTYYGRTRPSAGSGGRDLAEYHAGCAELIHAVENCLTDSGIEIAARLRGVPS